MTPLLCCACLRKTRDDQRIQLHAAGLGDDPEPQLVATYCPKCWGALSESLRILEKVIRT